MPNNFLNITSANAVVTLACEGLIPNPVRLQNFSADQSVSLDEVTLSEGQMGVDGGYAAGYVNSIKSLTLTLEANSPSTKYLDIIAKAMHNQTTVYLITLTVTLPSLSMRYIFSNGTLASGQIMSNPKKLQEPTTWKFNFAALDSEEL